MSEQKYFIKKSTLDGMGNALREVTGTTEKIPIANFESTIRGLSNGGSGGGGGGEYILRDTVFTATAEQENIQIALDGTPDIIYIFSNDNLVIGYTFFCIVYSQAMLDRMSEDSAIPSRGGTWVDPRGEGAYMQEVTYLGAYDNPNNAAVINSLGFPRNVTANGFTLGGGGIKLHPGSKYYVACVTGIAN